MFLKQQQEFLLKSLFVAEGKTVHKTVSDQTNMISIFAVLKKMVLFVVERRVKCGCHG